MKSKHYFVSIAVLLASCNAPKEGKDYFVEEKVVALKEFILKSDTSLVYQYDTVAFDLKKVLSDTQRESGKYTGLMYILNSDCSVCIGEFLDFALHLERTNSNLPIITIIKEGSKEILSFYAEETGTNIANFVFTENIDAKYIKKEIENQNGEIFYVYNNQVINSCLYRSLLSNSL